MSESTESPNSHLVEFKKADYVFKEAELGTEMFIVHRGKVEVLKNIDGGVTQLAVFEQGDFFGKRQTQSAEKKNAEHRSVLVTAQQYQDGFKRQLLKTF